MKADARARALACKQNPGAFWNGISKDSCKKATSHVNKVGDAVGADDGLYVKCGRNISADCTLYLIVLSQSKNFSVK